MQYCNSILTINSDVVVARTVRMGRVTVWTVRFICTQVTDYVVVTDRTVP